MRCNGIAASAMILSLCACGGADAPPMRALQNVAAPTQGFAGTTPGLIGTAGRSGIPPSTGLIQTSGAAGVGSSIGNQVGNPVIGAAGTAAIGGTQLGGFAGVSAPPSGGPGAAGQPGMTTPTGPAPAGSMDPVIPAVAGDCPMFTNSTITFMGLAGIQIVVGPKKDAPTAPMVFYWHGTGSTAGEFGLMATAVQQGVVAEGGVLVSFQGSTGGDLLSGTAIFGAGDFKLADQLLACAVKNYNIDPRRVYTMGCSAGGLFSAAMAAERSTYIAAAAPNSGGWTVPVMFQNKHVPALMTVHGKMGSDVVAIDFAQASATADKAFKAAGGFAIDCDTGGGHCGGGGLAGDVWKFFTAHPFGVSPEPWATALPAGFSAQCKIQ
jgi:predicted esterase